MRSESNKPAIGGAISKVNGTKSKSNPLTKAEANPEDISISKLSGASETGTTRQRYEGISGTGVNGRFQTGDATVNFRGAYSSVKPRAERSADPITGGVGSQSRGPRGVQAGLGGVGSLPPGGFQNTGFGGGFGGGGAPRSSGGARGASSPKTSNLAKANPYGKTTKNPSKAINDALTKALLNQILKDRKVGEEAVKRNAENNKVESINQAILDKETQNEIAKLSKVFEQDAKELKESIEGFQQRFEDQLKETPEDQKLDKLLTKVSDEANSDSMKARNADGSLNENFNPQAFIDAAGELDQWVKDNDDRLKNDPNRAEFYKDLKEINSNVQSMKGDAEEMIAIAENNPRTSFEVSEKLGDKASEEAIKMNEMLQDGSQNLSSEDQTKVKDFQDSLKTSVDSLNPGDDKIFNVEENRQNLGKLKESYDALPEELQSDPKIDASYKRISGFGQESTDLQEHSRTLEPDSAKHEQSATELIKSDDGFDSVSADLMEAPERTDLLESVLDEDAIEKAKIDAQNAEPEPEQRSFAQEAEAKRLDNMFTGEDLENIDEAIDLTSNTEIPDLKLDELEKATESQELLVDNDDNSEIDEIFEELELDEEDFDLDIDPDFEIA